MKLVRERVDFIDFFDSVLFGVAIIIAAFILFAGIIGPIDWRKEIEAEQIRYNLYLALSGEVTEDEKAIKTANLLSNIYHYQDFDSVMLLAGVEKGWGSGNPYFEVAVENYDDVRKILENEDVEIKADVPTWGEYFIWMGRLMWFFSAVVLSINYLVSSVLSSQYFYEPLTYPWKNAWSWPMMLLMFPYLIITQPILLVSYVFWKCVKNTSSLLSRWRKRKEQD